MLPQSRNVHAALASSLIICGTTTVPPRLQLIRRVHCRGHRFRHPSIGMNFHPDSVQTTSLSGTYCTGFHVSNEILGRASSRFVSDCCNSSMPRDGSWRLQMSSLSGARAPEGRRCALLTSISASASNQKARAFRCALLIKSLRLIQINGTLRHGYKMPARARADKLKGQLAIDRSTAAAMHG